MDDSELGSYFAAQANSYSPLYAPPPFEYQSPLTGIPYTDNNPLLGMLVQGPLSAMMGGSGMAPMGFHDQNVYDLMMNQRFAQMQFATSAATAADRDNTIRTLRGLARIIGTPWGADQMRAAEGMAGAIGRASPILNLMMPDLMDQMAGPRGSPAIMAQRILNAGRFRADPITGEMGYSVDTSRQFAQDISADLYARGPTGFRAGQLGEMYAQLSYRGLTPGTEGPAMALSELRGDMAVQTAARNLGITDLGHIAPDKLDSLMKDSTVDQKIRSLDASKISSTLQNYLSVVNTMRDIFGDSGKANAPMSELISALDSLTNGMMGNIQPGQLNGMLRTTQQLAQGIGIDKYMMLQQAGSQRAALMGMDPLMAIGATQGAVAFGSTVQQSGWLSNPAWGRHTLEQYTQMDQNLRLGASNSYMANRLNAILRLSDVYGGFQKGSDAQRYVEALQNASSTGMTTWLDAAGKAHSLDLSSDEATQLMLNAKDYHGNSTNLSKNDFNVTLSERAANSEYGVRYNTGAVVRSGQGTELVDGLLTNYISGRMANGSKLTGKQLHDASRQVAADMMDSDKLAAYLNVPGSKTHVTGQDVAGHADELQAAVLASIRAHFGSNMRPVDAANLVGGINELMHGAGMPYKSYQDALLLNDPRILAAGRQQIVAAKQTAQIRDALATLNRGSLTERFVGYLQNGENRADMTEMLASTFGVSQTDIQKDLAPIIASRDAVMALNAKINASGDPVQVAKWTGDRDRLIATMRTQVNTLDSQLSQQNANTNVSITDKTIPLKYTFATISGLEAAMKKGPLSAEDQKRYNDLIKLRSSGVESLALGVLSDRSGVENYGAAGMKTATAMLHSNNRLKVLADLYTGGDISKLTSGDISGLSAEEKKRVMAEVSGITTGESLDVSALETARSNAQKTYGPPTRKDWQQSQDAFNSAFAVDADPTAAANKLAALYGAAGSSKQSLSQLAAYLKAHPEQYEALIGSEKFLKGVAGRGGKGKPMENLRAMYTAYAAAQQSGTLAAFQKKYGMSDAEMGTFKDDVLLEKNTGFINLGTNTGELGDLNQSGSVMNTLTNFGGSRSSTVAAAAASNFPTSFTISGTLDLKDGQVSGTLHPKEQHADSSAGMNHVPTA